MKSPHLSKKAIYLRVSCSDGRQDSGLQSQKHKALNYCKANSYPDNLLEIYTDKISGGRSSRPALDRLMQDCRDGKIDTVIVVSLSRLSRSMAQTISLSSEFSSLSIKLVSIQESLDFSTSLGKLVLGIMSSIFEMEKNLVSDRVVRGLAHAKSQGKVLGRRPTVDHSLVIRLYLQKMSYRDISKAVGTSVSNCFRIIKKYKSSEEK